MEILKVSSVSKSFAVESGILRNKSGAVRALEDVSLSLQKGEIAGILGESGSGKTTMGRVICRLIEPDAGAITIGGRNIVEYSRRELAGKVQMIFQDPFASLNPKLKVGTILSEAAEAAGGEDGRDGIEGTLRTVGLSGEVLSSYPHQFSGGQRQRIAIARALLRRPEIIIADEPLSALDISIQNQLLELFLRLKETHSLSFVFISHDIVATSILADFIAVMKEGKIVEQGPVRDVIGNPQTPYTSKLLAAVPRMS
ncbi:MAG: ATP-binding cassette domain-containing protein [Endomicrobiales bacterium]